MDLALTFFAACALYAMVTGWWVARCVRKANREAE